MIPGSSSGQAGGGTGGAGRGPIVGIDLGTTYSLVAVAGWPQPGVAPRVLEDESGRALCPSVVRYFQDRARPPLVGWPAREDPDPASAAWTVASAKRLMGRSLRDARSDAGALPFVVAEGPGQTARALLPDGRLVSPQEVAARVLGRLKEIAERALGVGVERAVVTVPAYFDDAQRQATRDAGALAGLEVVRIVAEPTAAALAYGLGLRAQADRAPRTVAVYDLGGGTFDASVLRLTPGGAGEDADAYQVLSTAGDTRLGGDDFDQALAGLLIERLRAAGVGLPEPIPPGARRALLRAAESCKIALSEHAVAIATVGLSGSYGGAPEGARTVAVRREEFEGVIAGLVERTLGSCGRALRDARRELAEQGISAVVLVGGSSRVPVVRARVEGLFGMRPYTALDPDRVVALGAAVQGAVLSGATRAALLLDVIPLSLGIESAGGAMAKIITRNQSVPARGVEMFSTQADNQTAVTINVLQGEREMARDCRSLGVFHLRGLPAMPAGIPQVRVTFDLDANGVLSVSAGELRSGVSLEVQVVPSHGLTRQEVARIERESVAMARQDMAEHRVTDLVANSRLDVGWVRRQLGRHGGALAAGALRDLEDALGTVEGFIATAEGSPEGWRAVDPEAFYRAKLALDKLSVPLHEAAISATLREP
ncbi:MAG: hypothetical protein C0475_08475 [Planctomyces sp.]|nr:hypothetical protein [Planctomyces sp.]